MDKTRILMSSGTHSTDSTAAVVKRPQSKSDCLDLPLCCWLIVVLSNEHFHQDRTKKTFQLRALIVTAFWVCPGQRFFFWQRFSFYSIVDYKRPSDWGMKIFFSSNLKLKKKLLFFKYLQKEKCGSFLLHHRFPARCQYETEPSLTVIMNDLWVGLMEIDGSLPCNRSCSVFRVKSGRRRDDGWVTGYWVDRICGLADDQILLVRITRITW